MLCVCVREVTDIQNDQKMRICYILCEILTARPIFFAIFESVMLANGLSAPQHSTYFVIFDDGRLRVGGPPGVAKIMQKIDFSMNSNVKRFKIWFTSTAW